MRRFLLVIAFASLASLSLQVHAKEGALDVRFDTIYGGVPTSGSFQFALPKTIASPNDFITIILPRNASFDGIDATDVDLLLDEMLIPLKAQADELSWGISSDGQKLYLIPSLGILSGKNVVEGTNVEIRIGRRAMDGAAGREIFILPNVEKSTMFVIKVQGQNWGPLKTDIEVFPHKEGGQADEGDPPNLEFSLSGTSIDLGELSRAATTISSSLNATITTNASGWEMYVTSEGDGSNPGLVGQNYVHRIPGYTGILAAGTERFGLQCDDLATNNFCVANADSDTNSNQVLTPPVNSLAVWATNTSSATNVSMAFKIGASISDTTLADSYADVIRITASGVW